MTAQHDAIAQQLQSLAATGRPKQADLEEQRRSTEAELTGHLATLAEIKGQTYRGAAGPEHDDEQVVAEVDGNGTLLSMEISPYAMRDLDAAALAGACTEALEAARAALTGAFHERFAGLADIDIEASPLMTDAGDALRQAKEMTWPA